MKYLFAFLNAFQVPSTNNKRKILKIESSYQGIIRGFRFCYLVGYWEDRPLFRNITSPLLVSTAFGDFKYMRWKLENDKSILRFDRILAGLLCCIYGNLFKEQGACEVFQHIRFLLNRGLSPQGKIHTDSATTMVPLNHGKKTFWVHFILCAFSFLPENKNEKWQIELGKTIETFLYYGADQELSLFSIEPKEYHYQHFQFKQQNPYGGLKYERMDSSRAMVLRKGDLEYGSIDEVHARMSPSSPLHQHVVKKGGSILLRELISYCNFQNEEVLFELLEKGRGEPALESAHVGVRANDKEQEEGSIDTATVLTLDNREGKTTKPPSFCSKSILNGLGWSHIFTFILGEKPC